MAGLNGVSCAICLSLPRSAARPLAGVGFLDFDLLVRSPAKGERGFFDPSGRSRT